MLELTNDDLILFSQFEKITGVQALDYINNETVALFIVPANKLGKAIGKSGSNIQKLKQIFNKKVFIAADSQTLEGFIKNLLSTANIRSIDVKEDVMGQKTAYVKVDDKDRGLSIGKNGEKIKINSLMLKRKFDCNLRIV